MDTKACPRCKVEKSTEEFCNSTRDGHSPYCRECSKDYERMNKDRRQRLQNGYYKGNRRAVLKMYGGKCACCGEIEPLFLDVDHVHGGGTQHRKTMTPSTFYRWLLKERREGIQILCCNCNCGRWRNGGICPHVDKGNILWTSAAVL